VRTLDREPLRALRFFVRAFASGALRPDKKRLTVKKPEKGLAGMLEEAGFARVMLDYVLYR